MKKPLHIIIEGADGTGKSTVVQLLSRKYNLPIIKMPVPQDKVRTAQIEELSEIFNKTLVQFHEVDFICDRALLSSIVYSKLLNRTYNLNYINNVEQILDPVIIVMTASVDGNNRPFREDDIYSPEEINKVDMEYVTLAQLKKYPLVYVSGKPLVKVVDEAITIIENAN